MHSLLWVCCHLAAGKFSEEMKQVVSITDKLKKELPEMLAEHKQIVATLELLIQHAKSDNHPKVAAFAKSSCYMYRQKRKFLTRRLF